MRKTYALAPILLPLFFQSHVSATSKVSDRFIEKEVVAVTAPVLQNQPTSSRYSFPTSGDIRICVVLVEFNDVQFTVSDPQAFYTNLLNQENYSNPEAQIETSARDYFISQSHGLFRPQFDVYGPVRVRKALSDYFSISRDSLFRDAMDAVDADVDFSQYDNLKRETIDAVILILAGQEGNPVPEARRLNINKKYDNLQATCGTFVAEYKWKPTNLLASYGTFAHEFTHILGLGDHYSRDTNGYDDPRGFDLMAIGGDNRIPVGYNAYELIATKWATPAITLKYEPATITLPPLSEKPYFVKLETGRRNDYYLLECRKKEKFDKYFPAEGLLIWHIDASTGDVLTNTNDKHRVVDLVRANCDPNKNSGVPFPGATGNTSFGAATVPQMTRWITSTGAEKEIVTGREISNISVNPSTGAVTFDFNGGSATNVFNPYLPPSPSYIETAAEPSHGGTTVINGETAGQRTVSDGDILTLTATPNAGCSFEFWSLEGAIVSYNNEFDVTVNENNRGKYVAHFTAPVSYSHTEGDINTAESEHGRYTSKISLYSKGVTVGNSTLDLDNLQSSTQSPVYFNKTASVLNTEMGASVYITPEMSYGEGAHVYVYIDKEHDGFEFHQVDDYLNPLNDYNIKSGSDLGLFSNYSPDGGKNWYTTLGAFYNSDDKSQNKADRLITLQIPETLMPGQYRARIKIHRNSLDPNGDSDAATEDAITRMGGIIVDFTLNVSAHTASAYPEFTAVSSPEEGGITLANGERKIAVARGTQVTFTATPNAGYRFVKWVYPNMKESDTPITSTSYVISKAYGTKAGTYTAIYEPNGNTVFTLSTSCLPADAGHVAINNMPRTKAESGWKVNLNATQAEGFSFVCWTDSEGNVVANTPEATLTVTKDELYTAHFTTEVTGIDKITITTQDSDGKIFDLSGRQLLEIKSAGIYIINGEKVLVKNP